LDHDQYKSQKNGTSGVHIVSGLHDPSDYVSCALPLWEEERMPTIISGCDRLDCSGARRTTRIAGNSVRQVAGADATVASGAWPPAMRHPVLALGLLLAGCAGQGSFASSPYHAPNELDISHAGGGGGGGGAGGGM
jgi:hypothetical protein